MKNYLADYNLTAVSASLRETAINTEQTASTTMLVPKTCIIDLERRREDNKIEATGKEEPDTVYDLGTLAKVSLDFEKAQAQHFGFGLCYGLGTSTPAAWGTGYQHAILPTSSMDLPGFTAVQRIGNTLLKRRFASLYVDDLKATFAKDSWAKLTLGCVGTGKYTDNVYKETVAAAYNATTFTLAANGVQGSTAALRVDNVHNIRVLVPATGEYVDVVFTVVSAATPAVITFVAPGVAATVTNYEIIYVPTEPAWCTFPARVEEPPLRVTDLVVKFGGKWSGSAFLGGHTVGADVESIEYSLKNGVKTEFRVGGSGAYANSVFREGRVQTLALKKQMREFLLQRKPIDNEYSGVYIKATGVEFETGKAYYVELIFPRCNVLKSPISVDGSVVAEAGDLIVLQDDTYGSVIANVGNKVAGYAQ